MFRAIHVMFLTLFGRSKMFDFLAILYAHFYKTHKLQSLKWRLAMAFLDFYYDFLPSVTTLGQNLKKMACFYNQISSATAMYFCTMYLILLFSVCSYRSEVMKKRWFSEPLWKMTSTRRKTTENFKTKKYGFHKKVQWIEWAINRSKILTLVPRLLKILDITLK